MSTNVNTEDGESDGRNAEAAERSERPGTPEMECPICLDELKEKTYVSHTDMCRHLFCRECLRQWSTIQSFCPICMQNFSCIIDLPQTTTRMLSDIDTVVRDSDVEENIETDARRTLPEVIVLDLSNDDSEVEFTEIAFLPTETYEPSSSGQPSTSTGVQDTLEQPKNNHTYRLLRTRRIKNQNCLSSDVDSTGKVPPGSRTVCRKRKIQVETNQSKKMKKFTGEQQNIVGRRTPPEVIVPDSSSHESDVEIVGIDARPIETCESSSVDQPSTSTGVRETLEQSKDNYTYRLLRTRRIRIQNCPSSDVDSTGKVPPGSRTVCRKRKRQVETNQSKKIKESTGDQQTIVGKQSCSSDEEDV